MTFITIFTPTYNRANTLIRLYESLTSQSVTDFEWLIVDDGSSDNTEALLQSFIAEGKVNIRYVKQQNGGKHRAINLGLSLAKGTLFFIVDSDDYLPQDSIASIFEKYKLIEDKEDFAGVAGRKGFIDGLAVGSQNNYEDKYCNALDFRYLHHIQGDMAEVFRTSILKKFPFPEIENERFCPEALIWNRIAQDYKLLFFDKIIYTCEYLPGGLTAKIVEIRMKSPISSCMTYSELAHSKVPLVQQLKAGINFWRFYYNIAKMDRPKMKKLYPNSSIITRPIGLLMHKRDLGKF